MITIIERRKGINRAEIWYAEERTRIKGFISYREAQKPLTESCKKVRTLMTDLTKEETDILAKFTKNCRYEIRRAPRENIHVNFYMGKEITEELCNSLVGFLEQFWKNKGRKGVESGKLKKEIIKYAASGNFAISVAGIGETALVYHTYIVGEDIVRLYQSVSLFRENGNISQSVVGIANRYLHKEDMMWFKGMGKSWYDWGGAGEREEVASITKFKEAFGGIETFLYNGEEITGCKARLWHCLIKALCAFEQRSGRQGKN